MIQDIFPSRLDIAYKWDPDGSGFLIHFKEGKLLAAVRSETVCFPTIAEASAESCNYLFALDGVKYYIGWGSVTVPDGFQYYTVRELRDLCTGKELFAAFTAYHLAVWYDTNRFCGKCGGRTEIPHDERALTCSACGNRIYPRINPAVIVGVVSNGRLLITRYRTGYAHNALVAGFTEIGETPEQTVAREVMEETGLRVRNIRYYKSQPWGMAQDLLLGFYCEADGSDEIRMDASELKYAAWLKPEEIELQPRAHSLTNEMMQLFRDTNGNLPL